MLITGHKGFIGGAIHERVPESHGFDIFECIYRDIREIGSLHCCYLTKHDVTIHLAAIPGVQQCIDDPIQAGMTNVIGSLNVLEAARVNGCHKVVLASSGAVKASGHPYAASKRAMEDFATAYRDTYGLNTVCLRLSNVYGSGSKDKTSAIAQFCKDALIKGQITIYGDGKQTRDFVYIDDVVDAFLQDHDEPLYQVASGLQVSLNGVAEIIACHTGSGIVHADPRQGDVRSNRIDTEIPTIYGDTKIEDGVIKTLEYFRGIL